MALRRTRDAPPARAGGPEYGDIDPSDEVHDEIRVVAAAARQRIIHARNPQDEDQMLEAVREYGLAPGAQKMMNLEMQAALWSIEQGTYVSFRTAKGGDCTRVGPNSGCFCRHNLAAHDLGGRSAPCRECPCSFFRYFPRRPEECGLGHLPRRKDFDIRKWSPPCQCKHRAHEHEGHGRAKCTQCRLCHGYVSDWCCVVCDRKWEEHETVFESEAERRQAGRPTGEAYKPLSDVNPEFAELVYGKRNAEGVYELPMQTDYQRRIKPPSGAGHAAAAGGGGRAPGPGGGRRITGPTAGGAAAPAAPAVPGSCRNCGAGYSSATAKFCPQCGAPRQRSQHPFED
eukprot:TRINITY_DN20133_c0_g1_i1.p2 TRINITY_DN20133_c0_g1~~TRINITY_DN20133_c0_g1_i1.p2  ORF type:complete len:342 (+),score=61.38 TRINITY_DN20133_c0_g1_i1:106-1131(+)